MTRRPDLVLRASAGTGKTHRLTREYFERLGPDEVAHLVMVTFTDNAAAELRMRISASLRKALRDGDGALEDLVLTRDRLPEARVSTLHTFCRLILADRGPELGLGPDPVVLDDRESREWMEDAVVGAVLARVRRGDRELAELLRDVRLRSPTAYGHDIVGTVRRVVSAARGAAIDLDTIALPAPPDPATVEALIARLAETRHGDPDAAAAELRDLFADGMPADPAAADAALGNVVARIGDARGRYREPVQAIRESVARLRLALRRPLVAALVDVVRDADRRYRGRKRDAGRIDFDDMIHQVVELAADPAVRDPLRAGIDEILVDEAQDLSRTQQRLLLGLWNPGGNRLVVCGDRKQSIYGWRNADPAVLDAMERRIGSVEGHKVESLTTSFRSSDRIVEFVNLLCPVILGDGGFDPEHDTLVAHPGAVDDSAPPAVEWIDGGEIEDRVPTVETADREADAIGRRILALTAPDGDADWAGPPRLVLRGQNGELALADRAETGPLRFEDVVVLYRQRTHQVRLERAFRAYGIPYAVERGLGIGDCPEVSDLLYAVSATVDPDDALALAAALRSALFAVSDAALHALGQAGLLGARFAEADTDLSTLGAVDAADVDAVARAHDALRRWRDDLPAMTTAALVERIVQETDVGAVLGSLPQGEQRLANLRRAIERARDSDATGPVPAAAFVRRMRESTVSDAEQAQPQIVGGHRNVVRIMTIHKAKGLTFRCAVLPRFGVEPQARGDGMLCIDQRDGDTPAWLATFKTPGGESLAKAHPDWIRVKDEEKQRAAAEEGRIRYVAITRAQDLLILSTPTRGKGAANPTAAAIVSVHAEHPDLIRRIRVDRETDEIPGADPVVIAPAWETTADTDADARVDADAARVAALARTGPDPIAGSGNVVLGVSGLLRARRCRRWFWLASVARVPSLDEFADDERNADPNTRERQVDDGGQADGGASPANRFGTVGHAVLERVPLDPDPGRMRAAMRDAIARESLAVGDRERLGRALDRAATGFLPRIADSEVERESPFTWRIEEDLLLTGVIDLLARGDGSESWEIIDYKFSARSEAELAEQYAPQLEIYALACRAAGRPVGSATLVRIHEDGCTEIPIDVTDGRLDQRRAVVAGWLAAARELQSAPVIPPRKDYEGAALSRDRCGSHHCPFVDRCWGTGEEEP